MSKEDHGPEDALTSSEQELRLLVEALPALVWRAGPEGNIEYVNERVLDYLGAPLSEVIGWGWMDKVHPDDVALKVRTWLQNLASRKPHDVMCRFRGADGGYRWFEVRGEPLRANDGTVPSWCGVLIDIDDRIRAEEALRESEDKLRQIIDTVPGLLWSTGPDGEPTQINQRALDYVGMRFEDLVPLDWTKFLHPDDLSETAKAYSHAIQTGTSYQTVHRLRRADGEYRWHHTRGEPLRDRQGSVTQWYGLSIDIDEAKRAGEQPGSTAQLQANLNVLPAYTWYAAPRGALTFVNKRTADYLGVAKDHPLRFGIDVGAEWDHSFALLHPDDREDARKYWSSRLSTGEGGEHSYRVRSAQGDYRWFLTRMEPLRASDGTLLLWLGATLDIEELKCAEQALRRSEAYLAEAQRLSHTGSFGWTPSTGELHWSDETFRILEYDPNIKPTIERVLQRVHPDDLATVRRVLDETSRGERDFDITHRLLMSDSSVKFVHILSHAFKDAAGNLEIVGAVMDVTENTLLCRDLAEREAKVRRLVDANIIGVYIGDLNGRILEANDAFLRIVGYDCEDVAAGRINWKDLTPHDWRERDAQWIEEKERTRVRLPIEKEYFRKDGSRVPVLVGAAKFEGANQGVAFVLDLTERKKAEDLLRRSEAHLAEAQRLSHTGAVTYNGTAILFASEETYHIWGFDPAQGLPSREVVFQRIHPDDRDWLNAEVRRAVGEKRRYSIAYRILLPDGTVKHLETIGQPVFSASGKLVEIFATQTDVTERKKAEDQLRRSEAYLAEAQRLSQTGSWAWSPDQDIRYWSEECYRVLGFDPQDGLPRFEEFFQQIHLDDQPGFRELIQTAIREKAEWEADYRIVHLHGPVRDIHVVGHPVLSTSGHLIEFVGTVIDVTERRRAEHERARLRQLEADLAHINRVSTLGEMAASLAHEITQPIGAARNNARAALNFLDKQPADMDEVREALGCVVGDADRAGVIVDRMRDHIKKAPPRKHRFDLNEAINEVIVLARSAIDENGVSVQTRLTEGLLLVEGDRVQLQQVILNLVLNAAEAMSVVDRGTRQLLISTEQPRPNGVLVAVRDSGPGIDPELIDRVFEAFYTTKPSGVGMGLSICRSIVEAHNGRLWADANEPRGAVFLFTLPSANGAHESSSDRSPN